MRLSLLDGLAQVLPAGPNGRTTVKMLVVREPWASEIARGEKIIEYRCWRTHHRGPLLILAAKRPKSPAAGCIVAIAWVSDCVEVAPKDFEWHLDPDKLIPLEPAPFEGRGRLGLFDVTFPTA